MPFRNSNVEIVVGTDIKFEVQPSVSVVIGDTASTTKTRVTNFEISSNLRQYILEANLW